MQELKDEVFQMLKLLVDNDVEFGVTLNVKGVTITGILISGDKYFSSVVTGIESEISDKELSKVLVNKFDELRRRHISSSQGVGGSKNNHLFIHLKEARIFTGNELSHDNTGIYWRGKIDSIDGYSIGSQSKSRINLNKESP